ncbi:MAG: hypothetical protein ACK5Q6_03705 [Cyanobacteriota bacterium]
MAVVVAIDALLLCGVISVLVAFFSLASPISFTFVGSFVYLIGRLVITGTGVLHLFEQGSQGPVVHLFKSRQRQCRLVAHRQENDGIPGRSRLQLEVEQALVEDADVLAGEIGEVDRHRDPRLLAALPQLDAGAADLLQHPVHITVRKDPAAGVERGGFKDLQGAVKSIRRLVSTNGGLEQFTAVSRNRQGGVMTALVNEAEQREQPRPGAPGPGETTAATGRCLLQFLEQAAHAVSTVIQSVVARQQITGFGEQHHDESHHHPHSSAVDVGRVHVCALVPQDVSMALNQKLHGLPHTLAQRSRQLGLTLAAVEHSREQGPWLVAVSWRPRLRREQGAQGLHLG